MRKIGKFIQRFLNIILVLLILGTIFVFAYPRFADKTDLDDKAVTFLAEQTDKITAEEVATEAADMVENVEKEEVSTEEIRLKETVDESRGDTRVQTWSDKEKEALRNIYAEVLRRMGLDEQNLLFYEIKETDEKEYYTFQVVDDFDGAFERLLYYDSQNGGLYWHQANDNLVSASSEDCIYSGKVQGREEVDYEDSDWKSVLDQYIKVMFDEQDREKADTYVDSSCYYLASLSESNRKRFIDSTIKLQEELIELSESYEEKKAKKTIDSYSWKYEISDTEKYVDEYDMDWVDVYVDFKLDVKQHGNMDYLGEYYCFRLREYPYGWRVASFSKE